MSNTQPGTRADVAAELARVCELMSLADGDEALADEIAGVLMACKRGRPLPDPRQMARQLRSGVPNASSVSVGEYLTWWVTHRNIDEHTRIGYASHVRVHLDPHLGHLPLARLNSAHIEAMFATITGRNRQILEDRASADPARAGAATATRLTTPATIARVRATLRKALNDAMAKHRLIDFNPAVYAELPAYDPPRVRVWTERAIAQWKAGGMVPSEVMVWTPEQAGAFLDHAQRHDPALYPMFLLIMLGGPRRGEVVGVRTDQIDFDDKTATFSHQLTEHGYQPVYKKVKTRSGDRVIFLDSATFNDLRAYWELRESWRIAAGARWPRTVTVLTPVPGGYTPIQVDLFFRQPDGRAWHPSSVTDRFQRDAAAAGLPPIRLHDGRHSAATYMKAAGADLLDMRKKLGHASVTVTGDIYPASLDEIDRMIAERTAALIPRNRPAGPRTDAGPTGPDSPRAVPPATDPTQRTKDQVTAQEEAGSPTDSPTPRPPATGTAGAVPWPRPGRRRDRYPRDVR
ncbi:tyrosine-type recombinase/integrase [Plantactinospora sp. BB1]|uniref:tyrosine-type recombinase/integrase n=1 Tax=Plantactinospora sp. BB1 TaxID=2071627 RepID=UPI00131ED1AE|nr:tyrosine-type recombinase/integrase [Plantactinospora sp. BB1]